VVFEQDPAAGTEVEPGTAVNLVVATGPCPSIFTDLNLEAVVRDKLGLEESVKVTEEHLLLLTELDASGSGVYSLGGLENATNLEYLFLSINSVTDMSPLSALTKLKVLDISSNSRYYELDISALAGLTDLTELFLSENYITDISALADLTKLELLNLSKTGLGNVGPLAGLTNLEKLYLNDCQNIVDVSALSGLSNLWELDLRFNAVVDAGPLANLSHLKTLNLEWNQIQSVASFVTGTIFTIESGCTLFLSGNINISATACNTEIPAIESRGVTVWSECPD
jgi:hypothetical protein